MNGIKAPVKDFEYGWLHLICAWLVVGGLALHLSWTHFQVELNSDHLYPHMFIKDWLFGRYPLDAWKFGSATFLFPDYLLYALLLILLGDTGQTFPIFGVLNMLLLGAALGWAIRCVGDGLGRLHSFVVGYYVLGFILLLQFIPFHGFNLYWLLLPGFHGSSLILGITICALWMRAWREGRPLNGSEIGWVLCLGIPGLFSNTLLLTQFLVPWLLTQFLCRWFAGIWKGVVFRDQLKWLCCMSLGVVLIRQLLSWFHYWEYGNLFRAFPYPLEVWRCGVLFWQDFIRETGPRLWFFWGLLAVLIGQVVYGLGRLKRKGACSGAFLFSLFSVISVLSAIGLPVVALYWKSFLNSRYFLNLLVLPSLGLSLWLLRGLVGPQCIRRYSPILGLLMAVGSLCLVTLDFRERELFYFPYPEEVLEYDQIVAAHGLSLGLSDYWSSHYYNELSKGSSFLNHIEEEDGTPFFWCNNVYWFYGPTPMKREEGGLQFPDYDFILTNGMDEAILIETYGRPDEVIEGQYNRFFIYHNPNAIRSVLEPRIQQWLEGKAWSAGS